MSAEHRICWVLVCDACRTELHDPDEEFVPHFDTVDDATDHAAAPGLALDTDGHTAARLHRIATCCRRPRLPLGCLARLRMPRRHPRPRPQGLRTATAPAPDCDATESATLATFPTTDEPHRVLRSLTATPTPETSAHPRSGVGVTANHRPAPNGEPPT